MATKGSGCSASGQNGNDDLPLPDDMYDHLSSLYFDDDNDDDCLKKPSKINSSDGGMSKGKSSLETDPPYILGTLIVRVVGARDLQPARNHHNGGLGDFLFGGGGGKGGSANPYASVKFGTSTQRTSNLYDTLDPVWPRGETMFMDVSLSLSSVTHPDPSSNNNTGTTTCSTTLTTEDDNCNTPSLSPDNSGSEYHDAISISSSSSTAQSSTLSHSRHNCFTKKHTDSTDQLDIPQPILTVAVFSASEMGKSHKALFSSGKGSTNNDPRYPNKKTQSGDSDDDFLGMASIDLTPLLTGKRPVVDTWLPLTGVGGGSGSVRIVCEYETTDIAPAKDDLVRFTRFCHPADLYPLAPGRIYPVAEVVDKDHLLLNFTSPEGWVCSFVVHRFMVLCVERHQGAVEACREEWQSITERLSHSPLVETVTETVEKLPEEGLIAVGAYAIQGGASLLGRWLEGGLDTAVKDVAFATNWDGRFNQVNPLQSTNRRPATLENNNENINSNNSSDNNGSAETPSLIELPQQEEMTEPSTESSSNKAILPNMPSCPITGEPMLEPVVAADGHTYERAAIARWLQTSDKSPLTGSILQHKELVPNYGLLSSLQEQAEAVKRKAPPPSPAPVSANMPVATVPDPNSDEDDEEVPVVLDVHPYVHPCTDGRDEILNTDKTEATSPGAVDVEEGDK